MYASHAAIFAWMLISTFAIAVALVGVFARVRVAPAHPARRAFLDHRPVRGVAAFLGSLAAIVLVIAVIGLEERYFSWSSATLWCLIIIGGAGLWLVAWGSVGALRRGKSEPNRCASCGYPLPTLESGGRRCPECGSADDGAT